MTRLQDQLTERPDAVFGYGTNLPSGNRMGVTAALADGDLMVDVAFAHNPPSEDDLATTAQILRSQLAESAVAEIMRGFMGGGQG